MTLFRALYIRLNRKLRRLNSARSPAPSVFHFFFVSRSDFLTNRPLYSFFHSLIPVATASRRSRLDPGTRPGSVSRATLREACFSQARRRTRQRFCQTPRRTHPQPPCPSSERAPRWLLAPPQVCPSPKSISASLSSSSGAGTGGSAAGALLAGATAGVAGAGPGVAGAGVAGASRSKSPHGYKTVPSNMSDVHFTPIAMSTVLTQTRSFGYAHKPTLAEVLQSHIALERPALPPNAWCCNQ